mgnify:CR=1 FL=1
MCVLWKHDFTLNLKGGGKMAKNKKSILITAFFALLVAFVLVGCGGYSNQYSDGYWVTGKEDAQTSSSTTSDSTTTYTFECSSSSNLNYIKIYLSNGGTCNDNKEFTLYPGSKKTVTWDNPESSSYYYPYYNYFGGFVYEANYKNETYSKPNIYVWSSSKEVSIYP